MIEPILFGMMDQRTKCPSLTRSYVQSNNFVMTGVRIFIEMVLTWLPML